MTSCVLVAMSASAQHAVVTLSPRVQLHLVPYRCSGILFFQTRAELGSGVLSLYSPCLPSTYCSVSSSSPPCNTLLCVLLRPQMVPSPLAKCSLSATSSSRGTASSRSASSGQQHQTPLVSPPTPQPPPTGTLAYGSTRSQSSPPYGSSIGRHQSSAPASTRHS
jgi:hypothetical protein